MDCFVVGLPGNAPDCCRSMNIEHCNGATVLCSRRSNSRVARQAELSVHLLPWQQQGIVISKGFCFSPPSWDTDRYSQILEPQSNKCGPQISTVEAATRTRASRGRTEWTARTFWCHFCPRNPTAVSKTAMNFLGFFWSCFLHITGCFRRNHVVGVQAAMWVFCSFPPPLFNRVFPLSICCGIAAS